MFVCFLVGEKLSGVKETKQNEGLELARSERCRGAASTGLVVGSFLMAACRQQH